MAGAKKTPWIVLGVVLFLIMGLGLVSLLGLGWLVGRSPAVEDGVLEIVFRGPMREGPSDDPFTEILAGLDLRPPTSVWDLRRALERAVDDPSIHALRLDVITSSGWATADEILELVDDFRASGKPVYSYLRGDFAADPEFYLATAGDEIWLAPAGGLLVNGLRLEVEFWKGTLDKLHVEPSYLMLEEYKSAAEPFSRTEMSEAFREQLVAVGEDVQQRMVERIAAQRGLELEDVVSAVNLGLLTAPEALERGWIDRLGFVDELEGEIAEELGEQEYTGIPLRRYLGSGRRTEPSGDRVALVFGEGPIFASGRSRPFGEVEIAGDRLARNVREAVADDRVRAVVFRVDSPGGSPVGSDHIWRAFEQAQEAGLPVVVSMADVAGSGGYWVAMGADRILVQPNTITGSIGVVFGKFNVRGFYEWIGANVSDVTLARNADILSFFETLEPEHEERLRAWMDQVYLDFRQKVAEGRGLEPDRVREIARGRIWSGVDAVEIGLADEIGGLGVALATARELAGLPADAAVEIFPRQRSFFEVLSSGELEVAVPGGLFAPEAPSLHRWLALLSPELRQELTEPRPWAVMPAIRID